VGEHGTSHARGALHGPGQPPRQRGHPNACLYIWKSWKRCESDRGGDARPLPLPCPETHVSDARTVGSAFGVRCASVGGAKRTEHLSTASSTAGATARPRSSSIPRGSSRSSRRWSRRRASTSRATTGSWALALASGRTTASRWRPAQLDRRTVALRSVLSATSASSPSRTPARSGALPRSSLRPRRRALPLRPSLQVLLREMRPAGLRRNRGVNEDSVGRTGLPGSPAPIFRVRITRLAEKQLRKPPQPSSTMASKRYARSPATTMSR
jgi:hypothetical protein